MNRPHSWQRGYLFTLVLILSLFSVSEAGDLQFANEREIDARLQFLEARLAELNRPSTYWQHGWSGFYGVITAAQLYLAIDEDDSDDSTKQWVGAVKSAGGLAMLLLKPLPVVDGLETLRQMPVDTRQQKLARVAGAESMLRQSALRAGERYQWRPHLLALGANLLGSVAIAAFGDSDDALGSAALGIAVSEAAIWSQPSAAEQHWRAYRVQFNGAQQDALNWRIVPGINSLSFQMSF